MRIAIGLLIVAGLLYSCFGPTRSHSVTIPLKGTEYEITYSMSWGRSMHQKFKVLPAEAWSIGMLTTVGYELYDKPYNSGVSIYRTADSKEFYFGLGYGAYKFNEADGTMEGGCYKIDLPAHNEFGEKLIKLSGFKEREAFDPSGRGLWNYIEPSQLGENITSMPASKYYKNLIYLGRFGLVRSVKPRRGNRVGFVPASKGAEPRFGLDHWCG
ncbi:hypothetical protein [Roseibium sp.]|uniref:hypothetical protein n=1 Tax=Roseibium sp. TaxID=1936156 RepID=UPI003B52AB09